MDSPKKAGVWPPHYPREGPSVGPWSSTPTPGSGLQAKGTELQRVGGKGQGGAPGRQFSEIHPLTTEPCTGALVQGGI